MIVPAGRTPAGPGRAAAAVLALVLVTAACTSGDDAASESATGDTATVADDPATTDRASPAAPTSLPPGTSPLTGEAVDESVASRPAIAVKVENRVAADPQSGLEVADLVVEELVEGGITRLLAVFQTELPSEVGPIRSARLVDADLVPAIGGALVISGARPEVLDALDGSALLVDEGSDALYRRADRPAPSDLFATGPLLGDLVADAGAGLGPPPTRFAFTDEPPAGSCDGCDGTSIDIAMSARSVTGWRHDPELGGYVRQQGDEPRSTSSGRPVVAANVVALEITAFDGGCCDGAGSPYVVIRSTGEGRAVVLRDGQRFEARWDRPTADSAWRLTLDGEVLPLAVGPTWLHLVPADAMPPAPGA